MPAAETEAASRTLAVEESLVVRDWLTSLPLREDKPRTTIRAYGLALQRLLRYAGIDPANLTPTDLDQATLTNAVSEMRLQGVSKSTLNQTFSAVSSFLDYCDEKDHFADVEPPDVRRIRKISRLKRAEVDPEYFQPSELRELYETARSGIEGSRVHWPLRDFAMCSMLAVLGLRASEVTAANQDWLTEERLLDDDERAVWMIRIEGKGGKIRRLPLSAELYLVNHDWQEERATRFGPSSLEDPLFVTKSGDRFDYERLRYWFRTLNHAASLRRRSLHSLRHTAGVQLANDGVPMHVIQKFLGHANVATTGIYTELAGGELVDVLKKSNANTMVGELLEAAR